MKHIYSLSLLADLKWPRWDIANAFVVVAGTEREARQLASREAGDEGASAWLDSATSSVEQIGVAFGETKIGIVCRDFRAG